MSAINSSITLFRNICELAESRINEHFRQVDLLEDKSQVQNIRIAALAQEVAASLKVKQQECVYSICLYLRNRPDLELRTGKNGGICRIGDVYIKTPMSPKECSMKHYDLVKECAFGVISEEFLKAREMLKEQGGDKTVRLNFEQLCAMIAEKVNIKQYAVYHCLREYVEEERGDLVMELGRYGGLMERQS